MTNIHYARDKALTDGQYTYTGHVGDVAFAGVTFKGLVVLMHKDALANGSSRVLLTRTDYPNAPPLEIGGELLRVIKEDPLLAYRCMDYNPQSHDQFSGNVPHAVFGPQVYIRVSSGRVEDPLSGTLRPLAYGNAHGWRIRGVDNRPSTWLPLVGLVDSAPVDAVGIVRVAYAQWALVDVGELIATARNLGITEVLLPGAWNTHGPWISIEDLQKLHDESKENAA